MVFQSLEACEKSVVLTTDSHVIAYPYPHVGDELTRLTFLFIGERVIIQLRC